MIYKIKDVFLLFYGVLALIMTLAGGGRYPFLCTIVCFFFSKKLWGKFLCKKIYQKMLIIGMNSYEGAEAVFGYYGRNTKGIYINGEKLILSQWIDYFELYPSEFAYWTYRTMDNKDKHFLYEVSDTDWCDNEYTSYVIINEKTKKELEEQEKHRKDVLSRLKVYLKGGDINIKNRDIHYEYITEVKV